MLPTDDNMPEASYQCKCYYLCLLYIIIRLTLANDCETRSPSGRDNSRPGILAPTLEVRRRSLGPDSTSAHLKDMRTKLATKAITREISRNRNVSFFTAFVVTQMQVYALAKEVVRRLADVEHVERALTRRQLDLIRFYR